MAEIHRWWLGRDTERYWLEVTDRIDVGTNLKAPQRNEKDGEFWSYSLVREVQPGDIVYHYDRPSQTVIALSYATGDIWEDRLVWAARGTYARAAGIIPHQREGWYAGLEGFRPVTPELTLKAIRDRGSDIRAEYARLVREVEAPLYFPFELGKKRPLRPMQGYLFKLPAFLVDLFPQLRVVGSPEANVIPLNNPAEPGGTYRRADEEASVGAFDPMQVDPAVVERGTRGHAVTQNALADYLEARGIEPRSAKAEEPSFDVAWEVGGTLFVAEVKSVTNKNEESQLRLGLGQLLQYRHVLATRYTGAVVGVLVTERKPPQVWVDLCNELRVQIVWPGAFERLAVK